VLEPSPFKGKNSDGISALAAAYHVSASKARLLTIPANWTHQFRMSTDSDPIELEDEELSECYELVSCCLTATIVYGGDSGV
jgi:hypothetical protein